MAFKAAPRSNVEIAFDAIRSIGLGYDICNDLRLKFCKQDSCLIELGRGDGYETLLPGGITVPDVPRSIKVDKGERMRYTSDVLSFQQMAEQFNQELSLSGKIPSGFFNHMFDFTGAWQKDAAESKSLAFDGWFITLYSVALSKSHIILHDHIRDAVPSSWDPASLARFIEKFGTHIIVGVKMGGKDVICMRQKHSSTLQPAEFQRNLKEIADRRFSGTARSSEEPHTRKFEPGEQRLRFADSIMSSSYSNKEENMITIFKRRGGIIDESLSHSEWLETVQSHPDVISMSFIPITSLLNGVPGSGFLSHAINLYLRYKPRIEELHQFLEFQLPRQWAPVFSDLPLGPQRKSLSSAYLQFSLMGPKLFVNTSLVDVGKRPVTGLRLYLEGKRGNRLAIHLQHLSSLPRILKLGSTTCSDIQISDRKYCEPIQWKYFSHIYTAPVESEEDNDIVTGAQLVVEHVGLKKVLFLRLLYSRVSEALLVNSEWINSPALAQKSGLISTLISTHFSTTFQRPPPQPEDVITNSAVYPGGPPVTVQAPRLLKLIDTTELSRGPQDSPGYWVVSGAKLHLERGKISLRLKFSLLTMFSPDPDDDEGI